MSESMIIFLLVLCIIFLICIVIAQQISFRINTQKNLEEITEQLKGILDQESGGQVMVFTENVRIMELAAQINRFLEQSSGAREEFRRLQISSQKMLSNISHDIRTPMTVVLGYLEIMQKQKGKSEEMLEKTRRKAEDVMELTEQFFTLAKLESGDMQPELSRLDICELCRESVLDFYEILTGDSFQVEVILPGKAVFVYGNREALRRIFSNLISNAVRYGGDGKYLGIVLRTEGESILVDVADRGAGIDRAFAENVFDRLFTLEDSRSRKIQGNGLGLTIARNLARQMGGDITLDSEPGEKTVFTVRLKKYLSGGEEENERNL